MMITDYIKKIGGSEIYDHNLKDHLISKGEEVILVGGQRNISIIPKFLRIYNLKNTRKITTIIHDFKPDVIFAHSIFSNITPFFMFKAKQNNIPLVMKIANRFNLSYPDITFKKIHNIKHIPKIMIWRYIIKQCVDVFICPSYSTYSWLKNILNVNNIVHINNPIFWDMDKKLYKKKKNFIKILYVGRLEKEKGVFYLIKAVSILIDNGYDVKLFIIGEGSEKEYLKNSIKQEHKISIVFMGYMEHEDIIFEYADSDIFVLPSICEENSGLVLLEAMSLGLPLITTNLGGQAELVIENYNGFLVQPGDYTSLAKKIKSIIEDEELKEKFSKNSLELSKKYSLDNHVMQISKLFSIIVESRKSEWL